jgi:protein disulfide-isomerase A6
MKPDWDKLGDKYAASSSVVIGDVDCTVHQDLCGRFEVKGYPTIKVFTAESGEAGEAYNGGRDFDALDKFVTDNLAAKCTIEDQEGCSEKEVKYIKKMQAKDKSDVEAQITRLTKMKGDSMKPELKTWLLQRLAILEQL